MNTEVKKVYPECEKLALVIDDGRKISEFLNWLAAKQDIVLCRYRDSGGVSPIQESNSSLVHNYFDICPEKLDIERQEILQDLRAIQAK